MIDLRTALLFGMVALLLAGCARSNVIADVLTAKSSVPQENMVRTNQSLALPPDLRLPPPGTAVASEQRTASYAATSQADTLYAEGQTTPALTRTSTVSQAQGDIYDQYGISKYKPDGTRKTVAELNAELKAAILLKKKQANPRYGTIWNAGELFRN